MKRHEAVKFLEDVVAKKMYTPEIRSFVSFYHRGGVHQMVEQNNMKIEDVIAFAETKVALPEEVKVALINIFHNSVSEKIRKLHQ